MLTRIMHAAEFVIPGLYGERGGICDVQMFQGDDSLRAVVVLSEPVLPSGEGANCGIAVMFALADVVTTLVNLIPMNVLRVSFVLHTPDSLCANGREFFGLCSFEWEVVDGRILTAGVTHVIDWHRDDLEWLIGQPFVLDPLENGLAPA